MRIGLLIVFIYLAVLLSCRDWRIVARGFVTHTPWRQFVHTFFNSFPTSHWRGAARIIGVPIAWCFAALMFCVLALALLGIEIVFSPKAFYCQAVHLWYRFRVWFNRPHPTPPRAGALALPHPKPMLFTDARSQLRSRR